jgi:hypothetical protein
LRLRARRRETPGPALFSAWSPAFPFSEGPSGGSVFPRCSGGVAVALMGVFLLLRGLAHEMCEFGVGKNQKRRHSVAGYAGTSRELWRRDAVVEEV